MSLEIVSLKNRTTISKLRATKFFFFLSYFLYVISVTRYMVTQEQNIFYFLKHFIILIPSVFAFFLFLIRGDIKIKRSIIAIPLFLGLVIIIYVLRGTKNISDVLIFFQFLLFLLSSYFYSDQLFSSETAFKKSDFILLFIIVSIPAFFDVFLQGGLFIYNSYYGRTRLLLGFFHPKEAGISILTIALLYRIYISYQKSQKHNLLVSTFFLVLLYFVQSRNTFLFFLNFTIINILLRKTRVFSIIAIYFLIPFFLILSLMLFFYEEIDSLSSRRFSIWTKQFDLSLFGNGGKMSDYSVTKSFSTAQSDNFYLQYLLENGIVFFSILLIFLSIVVHVIGKMKFNGIYVNAVFIAFLWSCFFDAGMFSSGNFLNLIVWSFVFAMIARKFRKPIGELQV